MSLPTLAPSTEAELYDTHGQIIMQTLGEEQFSFGLFSDTVKWDEWVEAVQSYPEIATEAETAAIAKFSDYVMKVECET